MIEKYCDMVVVGGGGSGLVAAVRYADLTGRKVIVLEKAKVPGGGMLFASTMRTFGSSWQKERGIPDRSMDFMRSVMDLTLWRLEPELVYGAIMATGMFFDWYSQYELPDILEKYAPGFYIFDSPESGQAGPQYGGFHDGSGRAIVNTMLRRAGELGVELCTGCRAADAEVTDGRITTILAESAEGTVRIHCGVCVLACSTWIRNPQIVEQVLPGFSRLDVLPNAHQNPAYTGDGLPIAEKADAFIDRDSFCLRLMGPQCSFGETSDMEKLTHNDYVILVDRHGRRFTCEPMVPRMDPFDTGHVLTRLEGGRSYFIFSENMLQKIIAQSQNAPTSGPFAPPVLPELAEVKHWFEAAEKRAPGEAGMADTPEALAEKMRIDADGLKETIAAYNASCVLGRDARFCKPAKNLVPLVQGPFYAIGGKLNTDGAFGGVRVDPQMRAYRRDGGVVGGLYVTGDFASGHHISLGGIKRSTLNDMSWALASGFIAATSAANAQ